MKKCNTLFSDLIRLWVVTSVISIGWASSMQAQTSETEAEWNEESAVIAVPVETESILTPSEAQTFLEQTLDSLIEERKIIGAGAVVLKGDQIIAAHGAGFEDREAGVTVDPARTRFRLGSITKTVTAAAVMQLVEAGKLDFDRDINEYLDFDASPGTDSVITLRHLLSHTAGYSDVYKFIFLRDDEYFPRLETYVSENVPDLIFEPGTIAGYSNYGITLAGYLVQVASGISFEEYVAQNIFEPLGMQSATMVQPPEASEYGVPFGYRANGDRGFFEYVGTSAAGAISSSLEDYARFMAMIVNGGEYQGVRILSADSVAEFSRIPDVNPYHQEAKVGYGLTWYVSDEVPGRLHLTHGGDLVQFHAIAKIYLDAGYSIIAAQNTEHWPITAELTRRFDELIEVPLPPDMPEQPDPAEDARVAGEYFGSRYSAHGVLKLSKLIRAGTDITALPEGGIRIGRSEYKRVGPLTYQNRENPGWGSTIFYTDESGAITHTNNGMQPLPLLERKSILLPQAAVTGILLALALIAGLVALFMTRKKGKAVTGPWLLAGAMGALMLAGIGVFAAQLLGMQVDIYSLTPARDGAFRLAQGLMGAGMVMLVVFAYSYFRRLLASQFGAVQGVALALFLLAGASASSIMLTWNFLSSSLSY